VKNIIFFGAEKERKKDACEDVKDGIKDALLLHVGGVLKISQFSDVS
jgi:hypothetical protein